MLRGVVGGSRPASSGPLKKCASVLRVYCQASPWLGTYPWRIAIDTGSPLPRRYSRLPASGAICAKFAFSVRNRPTSSSGLTPSSRRRKTLSIKRSPKITELLLCSATESCASRRTVSGPRRRANACVVEPIRVPAPPAALRDVAEEHVLEPVLRRAHEGGLPTTDRAHLGQPRRQGRGPVALEHGYGARLHREPVEGVGAEGQEVRRLADDRHLVAAEELHRHQALPLAEVQLNRLQEPRKVGDAQDLLRLVAADVPEHLAVLGPQQLERAAAKRAVALAQRDQALGP